jgi:hypothetical protein
MYTTIEGSILIKCFNIYFIVALVEKFSNVVSNSSSFNDNDGKIFHLIFTQCSSKASVSGLESSLQKTSSVVQHHCFFGLDSRPPRDESIRDVFIC